MAASVVSTELKLHRRHGVFAGTAAMAVGWSLVLLAVPSGLRPAALPWVLFLEVTALGFFFLPALAVVERAHGVTAALRLTGLRPLLALSVRLGILVAGALAASAPLMAVSRTGGASVIAGVALTALLFGLTALVMVGRAGTLTAFLSRAPLVAIPLLTPALLHAAGVSNSVLLHLSPATAGWRLLAGEASAPSVGWLLVGVAALWAGATRIGFDVLPAPPAPSRGLRGPALRLRPQGTALRSVRSFAVVDLRTLLGDRILLLLVGGIPLIVLVLGWVTGPGIGWIERRYGFDFTPHVPALQAFVLAAHIPVIFGALTALLFLEDRDAGLMPAVAATPAGVTTLVAYRLTAAAVVTALAVGASMASGAGHPAGWIGVLATAIAAGGVATVPAAALAALAGDRVQGMAMMKAISLPIYLPVAWWFVDGPAGWILALVPTGPASQALWAPDPLRAAGFAAASGVISAAWVAWLLPRLLRDY
ncbi:MAG: hypothetical protein WD602_10360 [Actinomycetota bacterium]